MIKKAYSLRYLNLAIIGAAAGILLSLSLPVNAVIPLLGIEILPDISVILNGELVTDEEAAIDDFMGTYDKQSFTGLPVNVDVIAYQKTVSGWLLAFNIDVELPGSLTVRPGDVVSFDGASYSLIFNATTNSIPHGVKVDAVTTLGSELILSFDTTIDLGSGLIAADEDLVKWNGSVWTHYFDASVAGINPALDLDGAHRAADGKLFLSFDGSGSVGSGPTHFFDDEDVLEYDPVGETWDFAYDALWSGAPDVNALFVDTDPDDDQLSDIGEIIAGTNPLLADTEGDGLNDGEEVNTYNTDPLSGDTDGDGFMDGEEVTAGTDPNDGSVFPLYADGDLAPWDDPDGVINAADFLIANQLATGQRSPDSLQYGHGDMNLDGIINAADLLMIQMLVLP